MRGSKRSKEYILRYRRFRAKKVYILCFAAKWMFERGQKRGQVAIFVIVAVVIIGGIIAYFILTGKTGVDEIPEEFQEVYEYYAQCIEGNAEAAIDLAQTQGGRIYNEGYIPGSEYAPFSSQLNFMGFGVPYWYYVSGNGVIKEQVPTKTEIEGEIARYVQERECNFDQFYGRGFEITLGGVEVESQINDLSVNVEVKADMTVSKDGYSARKTEHLAEVDTKLGKFYNLARKIYDAERKGAFLENYSIDVLRLYAPVDGVEISCSPKIWKTRDVVKELKNGLRDNLASLKFEGNYYELSEDRRKYFVVPVGSDESVQVGYYPDWPTRVEVFGEGVDEELMIASPIGNQQGMGAMGFCYAPYHYVYDVSFPALIQIYDSEEIFQFPMVVVIDKNTPRRATLAELEEEPEAEVCKFLTQDIQINVKDTSLGPVDANLSYKCFSQICRLGETREGVWAGNAPACLNGYVEVRTEGYGEASELFSTNTESSADVILEKEYNLSVGLNIGGKAFKEGTALVVFSSDSGKVISMALPEMNSVKLSEGQYSIKAFAYGNSSIVIPSSTKTECREVPKSGLAGIFGGVEEKCFDITLPETKIEQALLGGGISDEYLLESELGKGKITLNAELFSKPETLEQLQYNFEAFESTKLGVEFGEG